MLDVVEGFVAELRAAGVPVSLTESLDALAAVGQAHVADRARCREARAATLVKRAEHRPAFDTLFEVWFSLRAPEPEPDSALALAEQADFEGPDEELAALLEKALAGGDPAAVTALARLAVARFAGMAPGRALGPAYHLNRALRRLDADGALARLLGAAQEGEGGPVEGLELRLRADQLRAHRDRLRDAVESEVRRRLVAEQGPAAVARALRRPLPEDVEFMHATGDEMAALRRALQPLARRLAVRLARQRRHHRRGPLDFRSTVRHSLSYGGVPAEPRFRHRRPSKPEIVVVADVSGSVAAFARFTLQFVHAISSQFSRVRSFVFVDGIDEVTHLFEGADDLTEAVQRVNTEADVIWAEGHSDYGHALTVFAERWGPELTPRTSVVVLGDARNNYHASEAGALAEVAGRARHLWWLNPEPRSYWDTGDSIVSEYAVHCDGVHECRNLRQLERFVGRIA
ncbi:MAG TPA: VWA domain-containing protein [Acidimicrobiales bacterium]|nr:VWA domain-containing protein [Acidimicrobiales bacterium]